MLSSMWGSLNERLGVAATMLVFFLLLIAFGAEEFTVAVGWVGAVACVVALAVVGWFEMLATREGKRE